MNQGRRTIYRISLAQLLSAIGGTMAAIALTAEVYRQTSSAVWLSMALLLTFGISGLLSPIAGMLADRFDRRRVMVVSDLCSAAIWCVLLLRADVAWLLTFGFLASVAILPFRAASRAAVPNIVEPDDLGWANGTMSTVWQLGAAAGFAAGGIITAAAGPRAAFLINAGSFLLSAAIVARARGSFQETDAAGSRARSGHPFTGLAVIWREPGLRSLFVVWTVLYLTIDIALVADLPIATLFGAGVAGYGLINAVWAASGVAGAVIASRITTRRFEPWGVLIGTAGIGVGYFVIAFAPALGVVLVGTAIASSTNMLDEVGGYAIFQRSTEDAVRGRVFSTISGAGLLANATGFAFAGFITEAIGPRGTYAVAAAISLAMVPFLRPLFRSHRAAMESDRAVA